MSDDSASIRHLIDQQCDRFELELKAGRSPRIDDFLNDVPEHCRVDLRYELELLQRDYLSKDAADPAATVDSKANALRMSSGYDQTLDSDVQPNARERPQAGQGFKIRYVGDYEILDEIARGGMGVVYRAKQKSLNRDVALKMILSGELAGTHEVARFRSEAEAAANLDHPGIVPIFEVGQHGDQHYFSMGLVKGPSLGQVLREGPMERTKAAALVEKVARAIDYAHHRGVVHRDLKPGNILIAEDGTPQVTDFGLAKQMSSKNELTSTGQVIGTPAYMPPEQACGNLAAIGPASDIYSLGAILYALLSGRPPHNAESAMETLRQVIDSEPISVRSLNPSIPKDLETICAKCLLKEPNRRYSSAAELADELGRFLRGEPIHARPVTRIERAFRWSKRYPALAGLLAAVALLAATLAIGGPLTALAQARLRSAAQENEKRANLLANSESEARKMTEASKAELAVEKDRSDHALYARTISLAHQQWQSGNLISAEDMLASLPAQRRGVEWHYVDSLLHQDLHQFTGLTGNPRLATMTPDQQHVIVSEPGSDPKMLLFRIGSNQPIEVRSIAVIAINHDGSKMAVVDPNKLDTLKVIEPISGEVLEQFNCGPGITSFASFGGNDDSLLAVAFNNQTVRVLDTTSGKEIFNVKEPGRRQIHPVTLSPDGKLVAWRRADDCAIEIRDTADGSVRFVGPTSMLSSVYPIEFSPDGSLIAVGGTGAAQIVRANDGKTLGFLDGLKGVTLSLAFSPDGGRIAVTCEDGIVRVYDSKEMRLLTKLIGHKAGQIYGILSISFDASGDRIISCGADGIVKVWDAWSGDQASIASSDRPREELPLASQEVDYITTFRDRVEGAALSKDGKLFFTASRDGSIRVFESDTDKLVRQWTDLSQPMASVDYHAGTGTVVAGGGSITDKNPGHVIAWDLASGDELWRYEDAVGSISKVLLFDGGRKVAVSVGSQAAYAGELFVLDAASGERLWKSDQISTQVRDMAVSPDDTWIATVGIDPGVRIHDAVSGQPIGTIEGKVWFAVAVSQDGKKVVVGGPDWNVTLLDRESGDEQWSSFQHNGAVTSVAFAADDSRIISTSIDGSTRIWDAKYGDLMLTLEDSGSEKYELAVSQQGDFIASVGRDSNVKIRRLINQSLETQLDSWLTLIEDDFERDELGDRWRVASGEWSIVNGRLKGVLKPSTALPGTNEAMITSYSVHPADVDVSYDVQIDSPMMIQTILGEATARNMLVADFIGIEGTHLNRGAIGASIVALTNGAYGEVVSRRGGGFEFKPKRTYRFRVRRLGKQFELYVDNQLYRSIEIGMDVPTPLLFLQPIFGEVDGAMFIDNFVLKVPPDSADEIQATKLVTGGIDKYKLKPILISTLEVADEQQLLTSAEAAPFGRMPEPNKVRELALQIAQRLPDPPNALSQAASMAFDDTLSEVQFTGLFHWIEKTTPAATEQSLLVQSMVAYRAGDFPIAKESLLKAREFYGRHHGTDHPVELSLRGLIAHKEDNSELAIACLRDAQQLRLAERWKNANEVTRWVDIAAEVIDVPDLDADAVTLARRVWEIDTARMLRGDLSLLESAVAPDGIYISRRDWDDDKFVMTVPRDRWLETERLWNSASSIGVHVIRSNVDVDLVSVEPIVLSRYAFEMEGIYFNYSQRDTFRRQPDMPAQQWQIQRRESIVTRLFVRGETTDMETDGWDSLDAKVIDAEQNGSPERQATALGMASRHEEALGKVLPLLEEPDATPEQLTNVVEAAQAAYRPDVLKRAAEKAIQKDPMIAHFPFMRRYAAELLSPAKAEELPGNIWVRAPSFYRKSSSTLLAGGTSGVAAWQPTVDSLVGIYRHDGQTLESFSKTLLESRSGALNASLIESDDLTVDSFPARSFVHSATGIGRAVAIQGQPTMQRFVLIQREHDLVAIIVSAYASEFVFRDSEFKYFLKAIKLRQSN